jgi:hypothetical protein
LGALDSDFGWVAVKEIAERVGRKHTWRVISHFLSKLPNCGREFMKKHLQKILIATIIQLHLGNHKESTLIAILQRRINSLNNYIDDKFLHLSTQ